MKSKIKIIISTLHWNTPIKLEECIKSFLNTYDDSFIYKWFIIDNNSKGDFFKKIKDKYSKNKNISFIGKKKNKGALSLNPLLNKIEAKYWVFLGPDTKLKEKTVLELIDFMESKEEAGIASAVQYRPNNEPLLYYRRNHNVLQFLVMYTFLGKLLNKIFLNKLSNFYNYSTIDINKINIIEQVPGACFIEKMQILEEIGYIVDKNFPFFFNDVDICKSVRDKNFKIFLVPSSKIIHDHSSSFRKRDPFWVSQEFLKSMIKYYRKHYKNFLWLIKYMLFFNYTISILVNKMKGRSKPIKKNKWYLKNIVKW